MHPDSTTARRDSASAFLTQFKVALRSLLMYRRCTSRLRPAHLVHNCIAFNVNVSPFSGLTADCMANTSVVVANGDDPKEQGKVDKPRWPLAYELQLPKQQQGQASLQAFGFESSKPVKRCWWGHKLYRGPKGQPVTILYSKTKEDSEIIARQFLHEPVVGFDMEWPWDDHKKSELQNKIGLIQIASEDKIGLIHIGLHKGKTTEDIIAPSLRKLIEDPKIGKLGVGILGADFNRIRRFFKLDPKGAVELSHLYRLTKFGGHKPKLISTKLVSLARLVEDQLGHPLYKGDVRTSNWSRPLSQDQMDYAAGDAYAGYMLYHCMNYKRLKMKPIPPLPVYAENYTKERSRLPRLRGLILDALDEDQNPVTSETFYKVKMADSVTSSKSKTTDKETLSELKPKPSTVPRELSDAVSQALYKELVFRRASLATKAGIPAYCVATNAVLVALAVDRPSNSQQLLAVKGIGPKTQETYGDVWLEVISRFLNPDAASTTAVAIDTVSATTSQAPAREPPSTPIRPARRARQRADDDDSPDSSPAFGTPVQRTPTLHTGLSFTMAETKLDTNDDYDDPDSDASLPSLDFETPNTHPTPYLKRKRTESPTKSHTLTASQRLQHLTQAPPPIIPHTTPAKPIPAPSILTPRARICRNKLLAFSKLVTRKIAGRPPDAPPIVSERTLSLIVVRRPRTREELERIPGIDGLAMACEGLGMDLLRNVVKFTAGEG